MQALRSDGVDEDTAADLVFGHLQKPGEFDETGYGRWIDLINRWEMQFGLLAPEEAP